MAVLFSAICAEAQSVQIARFPTGNIYWRSLPHAGAADSAYLIGNADSVYGKWRGTWYANMFITAKVTKTSGYQRGSMKLLGSNDTTTREGWYTIRGRTTQCAGCADSSVSVTNVAYQIATWDVTGIHFNYYAVRFVSDTSTTNSTLTLRVDGSH